MPKTVEVLTPDELVTRRRIMQAMYHREGMTFKQVGEAVGLSESRARQILIRANPKAWRREAEDRITLRAFCWEQQQRDEAEMEHHRQRHYLRSGHYFDRRRFRDPPDDAAETLAQSVVCLVEALEDMRDHPDLPVGKADHDMIRAETEAFYREQGQEPPARWWRREGIYTLP